jgi:hypothetical protein
MVFYNAWLSTFNTVAPPGPPPFLSNGQDTIRGGLLLIIAAQNTLFIDTARDQAFRAPTMPSGWTNISSGSGGLRPTLSGLVLDTGMIASSVAGVETPDDYEHFDVAVDVQVVFPQGPLLSVVDLAVLEARGPSGALARVRLRRGYGSDAAAVVVYGEFTVGGVTTIGGIELAPSTERVTLRIVRNDTRIFGFAAIRAPYTDSYDTLVKVIDYDRFASGVGKIRVYAQNIGLPQRVQSVISNYTVRSHGTIAGRLFDNKIDVAPRRLVGNVPAATVEELGLVDIRLFGLFGESFYPNSFLYVLPPERTLGRSSVRTLFTVQDPVLRDGV